MLNVKELENVYFIMLLGPRFFSKKFKVAIQQTCSCYFPVIKKEISNLLTIIQLIAVL